VSMSSAAKSKAAASAKPSKEASKKPSSSSKKGGTASRVVDLIDSYKKKESEKTLEELCKLIAGMKSTLTGEAGVEPNAQACNTLGQEATQCSFFHSVIENYSRLSSEARKDVVTIFGKLLKQPAVVDHLVPEQGTPKEQVVLYLLVENCANPSLCMNCNLILVECIRYEALAKVCLHLDNFLPIFSLIQDANFDVATNSFSTFKELLTKHKTVCATFLDSNYEVVFGKYRELLVSPNYVTKRTSLKLLGELLLDRANFHVMTKYISQSSNLKLMMTLLRDSSKNIQFEAFHVFKVFVANPKKPQPVLDILVQNKELLIAYLTDFHNDRSEDEQFVEEKQYLIKQIQALK